MGRTVARSIFVLTPAMLAAALAGMLVINRGGSWREELVFTVFVFLFVLKAGWNLTADRYGR